MRLEYTTSEAFRIVRANPRRSWGTVRPRVDSREIFDVMHKPKFSLDLSWPVFTIGSCFARNVEAGLEERNVPVLTRRHGIENKYLVTHKKGHSKEDPDELDQGAFNKYAVRSMLHEMRCVLAGENFKNEGLIELAEDVWFDPHSAGLDLAPFDVALRNRRRIAASIAEIRNARIVILTLGQTETWFDTQTGLHMNQPPSSMWLKKYSERFRFIDYGYEETQEHVEEFVSLIRNKCTNDVHFILTVSPIPMVSTWRNLDVAVANSATKTMLRTLAETMSRKYDYIDYFPSYEIATLSPKTVAYTADRAHVTPETVAVILNRFMTSYYPALSDRECRGQAEAAKAERVGTMVS